MQLAIGETVRIPFKLYTAAGAETVDTMAGNYTWPLQLDGAHQASPAITITNPSGTNLLLSFTPGATGIYTFGELTHATAGQLTNLQGGSFIVRTHSVDSIAPAITVPVADQAALVAAPGDDLHLYRNADFSVTIELTEADGVTPRDLTGSTFRFSLGDRTSGSDVAFHNETGIAPDSPATAGRVTIAITDTEAATSPFNTRIDLPVYYELEETTSGGLKLIRALGRMHIHRDIPAA